MPDRDPDADHPAQHRDSPRAGKTVTLTALSDALVNDGVAHSGSPTAPSKPAPQHNRTTSYARRDSSLHPDDAARATENCALEPTSAPRLTSHSSGAGHGRHADRLCRSARMALPEIVA